MGSKNDLRTSVVGFFHILGDTPEMTDKTPHRPDMAIIQRTLPGQEHSKAHGKGEHFKTCEL